MDIYLQKTRKRYERIFEKNAFPTYVELIQLGYDGVKKTYPGTFIFVKPSKLNEVLLNVCGYSKEMALSQSNHELEHLEILTKKGARRRSRVCIFICKEVDQFFVVPSIVVIGGVGPVVASEVLNTKEKSEGDLMNIEIIKRKNS